MLFGCIFFCSMLRDSMKKIEDLDAEHWHVGRRTSSRRSGERGSLPLPKKKGKKSNKAQGDTSSVKQAVVGTIEQAAQEEKERKRALVRGVTLTVVLT
jgi:phenylpyruvate tautomerase PptA (4-oxalocrotonate tautomerase family)